MSYQSSKRWRKLQRSVRKRLGLPPSAPPEDSPAWPPVPPEARAILEAMYRGEPIPGGEGGSHVLDRETKIEPGQGRFLYEVHDRLRPALSVEIGLAYGFSTLFFLSAMKNGGYGRHLAMDPFQASAWHGIGRTHAYRLGIGDRFVFEEAKSIQVLPRLIGEGTEAQLVFIDGNHRFDDVLVDFTLSAEIVPIGGMIVLDDLWMPSIQRVRRFIRSNRKDFTEREAGHRHFAAFERIRPDRRRWNHYVEF